MKMSNSVMKVLGNTKSLKIISSVTNDGKPYSTIAESIMAMGEDRLFVMEKGTDTLSENMQNNKNVAVLIDQGTKAYLLMATALERYTEGVFYEVMTQAERNKGTEVTAVWTFAVNDVLDKSKLKTA